MADSRKLVCTFKDSDGAEFNMSFNYASSEMAANSVKALMNGIVANGSIFEKTPVSAKGAKVVVTSESDIDISE